MEKINANELELFTTGGIVNTILINSPDDFPAAVGGVRELVVVAGGNYVYEIAPIDIDMGADVFTITGGNVVIRGTHRNGSRIITASPNVMFTSVDAGFFQEYVGFSSGGTVFDYALPRRNEVINGLLQKAQAGIK